MDREDHDGVLLDTSEDARVNGARVELYDDLYDQSGAAEALWAYPTGPKMERSIRCLITSL